MSNLVTSQPRSVAKINSKIEQPSTAANCERCREEDNDNCCFVYFFRLYCSQYRCSGCCHNEKQKRWRPQRRGANNYTSDTMYNEDIYITNGFLNDEGLITNGFLNDENPFTNKYSNNEQSLIHEYGGPTDHSKNYAEDEGLLHTNNEGRSRSGNNCGDFSEGESQLGTTGGHSGAVGHTLVHSEDGGYLRNNNNDSEGHCRSEGHTSGHSGGHSGTIHTIATGGYSEDGNHLVSGGHFNSGDHSGFNSVGHCEVEDYSSGYGGGNTTISDCVVNDTGGDNGGGDSGGDCGGGDTSGDCGGGDTGGDCGGGDTGGGGGDD